MEIVHNQLKENEVPSPKFNQKYYYSKAKSELTLTKTFKSEVCLEFDSLVQEINYLVSNTKLSHKRLPIE